MSIGACNDINFIIRRLLELEEKLGGQKKLAESKGDEFDRIRTTVLENIHRVRGRMNELAKKKDAGKSRTADLVRIRLEIQEDMKSTDALLESLKKILKSQQKNPKITQAEKDSKAQLCVKLESLYQDMRDEIEGKEVGRREKQIEEMKQREQEDKDMIVGGGMRGGVSRGQDFRYEMQQLHDDEDQKLKEWRAFDERLDNKLDDINVLLDNIRDQAVDQGQKMKDINKMTDKVGKQIDITNKKLDTENERLKDLVKKYRAPSRFCLDMILCLLIVGMIGLIVNMIR